MSIYSEQEEWKEVEVFVVVKTYPNASRKYQEVVCTAAITKEGEWIRLYPIQFRQMEKERRFKKYTWVKTRIKRASAPSGNFDLVFQQGGGRMVGRLRSLAKSAKALRLPTIQANL